MTIRNRIAPTCASASRRRHCRRRSAYLLNPRFLERIQIVVVVVVALLLLLAPSSSFLSSCPLPRRPRCRRRPPRVVGAAFVVPIVLLIPRRCRRRPSWSSSSRRVGSDTLFHQSRLRRCRRPRRCGLGLARISRAIIADFNFRCKTHRYRCCPYLVAIALAWTFGVSS